MCKQMSFTHLEKKLITGFRKSINVSEDQVDLQNHFAFTVNKLLTEIFKDKKIKKRDLIFDKDEKDNFIVSEKLMDDEEFANIWENSDLRNIIIRLAETTYNKYKHLGKHNEKTNISLRK